MSEIDSSLRNVNIFYEVETETGGGIASLPAKIFLKLISKVFVSSRVRPSGNSDSKQPPENQFPSMRLGKWLQIEPGAGKIFRNAKSVYAPLPKQVPASYCLI